MGQSAEQIRSEIEDTRARMDETIDAIGHRADVPGRVKGAVSDKVDRARSAISDGLGGIAGGADGLVSRAGDALPDGDTAVVAARRGVSVARENPLGLLLGGIAVGLLAGLALPATRVEDERLGETADRIKEQAADAGRDIVEQGRHVAGEAAAAAVEAAQTAVAETDGEADERAQGHATQPPDTTIETPDAASRQSATGGA